MSHATIHATFAARDVLTIPSPPWRSRIVSTPGRLRFRERTDYWQKYHSQSWKTDRDRRRLVYRAMAGETNDRPSTLRQKTWGRPLLRRSSRGAGRPTASSTPSAMELPSRPCTGHDTYPKLTAHSTTNTRMPTSLSPRMHAHYFTWYPRPPMQAP